MKTEAEIRAVFEAFDIVEAESIRLNTPSLLTELIYRDALAWVLGEERLAPKAGDLLIDVVSQSARVLRARDLFQAKETKQ